MLIFLGVRQMTAPEVDVTARLAELSPEGRVLEMGVGCTEAGRDVGGHRASEVAKRSFASQHRAQPGPGKPEIDRLGIS